MVSVVDSAGTCFGFCAAVLLVVGFFRLIVWNVSGTFCCVQNTFQKRKVASEQKAEVKRGRSGERKREREREEEEVERKRGREEERGRERVCESVKDRQAVCLKIREEGRKDWPPCLDGW